ncbi:MAG: hypothetical protein ABIY71_11150, partial [Flavobacteriales bacterium]
MKKAFYVVKLGHTRVTAVALVTKSRTNVTKMTGNPAFTTPNPDLVAIKTAADALDAVVQSYNFSRSRQDKEQRDAAFAELKKLRSLLGSYVQNESQGEQGLISSAGFETEKARQPLGVLPAPKNVRALRLPFPGEIEVRFGGVKGRIAYQLFICEGDPKEEANWQLHSTTGKNRVLVQGLVT